MASSRRRLLQVLPVVAAACGSWFVVQMGCGWEYSVGGVAVDAADDGDTGENDVAVDTGPYVLPDGRVCTGHDEDNDGVPDECDNCPNVANAGQGGGAVGTACAPPTAFIPSPSRLLFDPFTSISSWKSYGSGSGVFQVADDNDSLSGGSLLSDELRFIEGTTGAASSAVVVTTTITVVEDQKTSPGNVGIVFRIHGPSDAKKFYLCALSVWNGFAVARAPDVGCSGGPCGPVAFNMPGDAGGAAQFPIPSDIPRELGSTIGLRASVTATAGDGGTSGELECRVFDPKRPETLLASDAKYAIKVPASGTRWFSSGEVGVYAQKSKALFHSIDVLRGP